MTPELAAAAHLQPDSPALPVDTSCLWCGRHDCLDRFEHDRLHRSSETTWRRAVTR